MPVSVKRETGCTLTPDEVGVASVPSIPVKGVWPLYMFRGKVCIKVQGFSVPNAYSTDGCTFLFLQQVAHRAWKPNLLLHFVPFITPNYEVLL